MLGRFVVPQVSQPQSAALLARGSPLNQGLVAVWHPGAPHADLVNGENLGPTGTMPAFRPGLAGLAGYWSSGSDLAEIEIQTDLTSTAPNFTFMVVMHPIGNGRVLRLDTGTTAGLRMAMGGTGSNVTLLTGTSTLDLGVANVNDLQTVVVTYRGNDGRGRCVQRNMRTGAVARGTATTVLSIPSNDGLLSIGNSGFANAQGDIFLVAAWSRALSDHAQDDLARNPWQILRRREIAPSFEASGGGFQPAWARNANQVIQ